MSAPVPPALPPTTAATPASAPTVVRGTVLSLPANVTLAQGQALAAQVVSSGNGQIVLATHLGPITVQSTASLPPGASVLLQVQAAGEAPQVSLQLPQSGGALPAAPPRSANPVASAAQQAAPPVTTHVTEGSIVQAAVTRGAPPPTAGANQAQSPALPAASGGQQPAAHGATQAAAPLVAGAHLTLRVLAVSPPGGELPPAGPLATQSGARLLVVTIVGRQPGGAPIGAAGAAEVVLSSAPPLPTGSRVLLEMLAQRPPVPGAYDALPSPFAARWETLGEALALIQRLDPALARQVADGMVPTPGPRLAGSMLFFLSAVLSGEIRRFLDADAMRPLLRASGGLGARLASELGQMQRTATDASGQDWRLFLIPMLTNEGLEQLRFMLRKDAEDEKGQDDDPGTRFLIEADMSRLGPFQFEGTTRKKHLDLVVRTHKELPTEMREEIRAIFGNTVTALGFTGAIAFRAVPTFEISPVEQPIERPKDLTV